MFGRVRPCLGPPGPGRRRSVSGGPGNVFAPARPQGRPNRGRKQQTAICRADNTRFFRALACGRPPKNQTPLTHEGPHKFGNRFLSLVFRPPPRPGCQHAFLGRVIRTLASLGPFPGPELRQNGGGRCGVASTCLYAFACPLATHARRKTASTSPSDRRFARMWLVKRNVGDSKGSGPRKMLCLKQCFWLPWAPEWSESDSPRPQLLRWADSRPNPRLGGPFRDHFLFFGRRGR